MKLFILLCLLILLSCSKEKVLTNSEIKNFYYDKAFVFNKVGKSDSAFQYFEKAKNVFLEKHDSADAGRCLVNMAIIQEQFGDNYGGLETGISALKYFNDKDSSLYNYLSINYNTLGILSSKLTNYNKAIEFYEKAILFSKDSVNKNLYTNNLANNYRRNKDYNVSIKILTTLLNKNKENTKYKSRILDNLAFTKWTQNAQHNPLPEFQEALKIRLKDQDNWGLNSSYSHLADYYSKNNQDSALVYARKMFSVAKEIKSPDDQIEALQKLISLEDTKNSKQYFKVYQKLNDSLQTARNKAKNQFALIRYETEKNKADFLKAQAESSEKQNHIIKQYVALVFAFIIIIGFILYLKKDGEYQFNLKAGNGEIILTSEGYTAKAGCKNGMESVRINSQIDSRFERKISTNDKYYFVLKAGNGEIIGKSQLYITKQGMENGIESVKENAPNAEIIDETI